MQVKSKKTKCKQIRPK